MYSFEDYIAGIKKYEWQDPKARIKNSLNVKMIKQARAMRYNMINSFQILSDMELNLLRSQFFSWMRDQVISCRRKSNALTEGKEILLEHCKSLELDLASFIRRNKIDY